jgi:hypothetical protein
MTSKTGIIIFIIIAIVAWNAAAWVFGAFFFGVLILIGFIGLIESIPPLKWFLSRVSRTFDVVVFIASIIAMSMFGLNISAGLTVAGLGYTLIYAPHLRAQINSSKVDAYIKRVEKLARTRPRLNRTGKIRKPKN